MWIGALTIFLFWIMLVSGIWLFIFFRTSIEGAYQSVEYLTHGQWYLGGVMRSLHRYASDAAIVTIALHILHEWSRDRYRGKHWFSWATGMPLLWLVFPLGITGYWLVWDQLAHYVALTSAELLDRVPIFTGSMARNFLLAESLSDRFFTLMAFLHLIGLPLFLVFAIWLHVFRISRPSINPPRALMAGSLLAMLAVSFAFPALSQDEVDLAVVPQKLGLDWYYLLVYPLAQIWSPGAVWLLLVCVSLLMFVAPLLPPARTPPVAVVDLGNCNGCGRCADDCPYGAVAMQPRSDGTRYTHEAVVEPSLCLSCGICVGACPTATPFRKASALVAGIELPARGLAALREEISSACRGDVSEPHALCPVAIRFALVVFDQVQRCPTGKAGRAQPAFGVGERRGRGQRPRDPDGVRGRVRPQVRRGPEGRRRHGDRRPGGARRLGPVACVLAASLARRDRAPRDPRLRRGPDR